MKLTKRKKANDKLVTKAKQYSLNEAISILKKAPSLAFDPTVEVSFVLGVDPRKSDQQVRGTVFLPSGTGKKKIIVALATGNKLEEATLAGADYVGGEDLLQKIGQGWTDFDVLVTTPDLMRHVGRLGKILGPRGLMPTPKAGTVTVDIGKAIEELQKGRIEFKVDRQKAVNRPIGKLSFSEEALLENFHALWNAILRAKPSSSKGQYLKTVSISSTMGPGLTLDQQQWGGV